MRQQKIVGRLLLALAFVAGSWEDILPGVDGIECEMPWSTSLPGESIPSSDADDDAGDGFVLSVAPPEPLLISEFDLAKLMQVQSHLLQSLCLQAPSSVVVRRIPHIPILSGHL